MPMTREGMLLLQAHSNDFIERAQCFSAKSTLTRERTSDKTLAFFIRVALDQTEAFPTASGRMF